MSEHRQFEISIVGSCMVDFVTYTGKLPLTGETVLGIAFEKNFGGKGANQAVQCGRLGIAVAMCGVVGSDEFGGDYIKQLTVEGVNSCEMYRSETLTTGIASISVDTNGQNSIIIVPGANLDHTPAIINHTERLISSSSILICQNEINFDATLSALKFAKQHGTVSILNPAPVSANTVELLPFCDIICPNETELSTLSGGLPTDSDVEIIHAAHFILTSSGVQVVVVTLGSRGACIVRRGIEGAEFVTAEKVTAVDTVGAGDSFIGSFASHIARGSSITSAVTSAVHCASISVTRKGAQKSYPRLDELEEVDRPLGRRDGERVGKDEIRKNIGLV